MSTFLHSKTPSVTVFDNRGLTVREMTYHRHPDSPDLTDERIIRHQFNVRGFPAQSADPRLAAAGLVNFGFISDLGGTPLRTQSADAGTSVALNDASGRAFLQVSNIGAGNDRSAAVTRTFQYEDASLPGRPLSVTGQGKISERFVWAGNSADEQSHNLAGQLLGHYDPAGLLSTNSISLSGVPLSVTRQLLPDDAEAGWQGADASAWNDLLSGESYTTTSTVDSAGNVLTTTDAKGNVQRVAYDVAGLLKGSWLTVKGGSEQIIVKSLSYSAAGQKLREEHGNGVVTTYSYEAETQRLVGIKTERITAAKVLQDLRYEYDPVGNVLVITNDAEETRFWRNQEVVPENRYTYDSLYQLISATGREMANAVQQGSSRPDFSSFDDATYTSYSRTYTYDNAGNLTKIQHSAPASGNTYTVNMTVSDRSNRAVLSTFTEKPADVDALFTAGGQQKQLLPGQTLQWTARQELQQVTPVTRNGAADDSESYRYNASSQRIVKVTSQLTGNTMQTKRVIYLPGLELRSSATEELQVITVGVAGRAQVRVLHWESGQPDGISNDPIRYSYDNLTGSSSLEVDSSGELISQEEYYPYGGTALFAARSQLEADYKTIRYSGKEQDATGLYYYGWRYYQPWGGRWLSADPAGGIDGLNLFRMVRNNPVRYRDNNGLQPNENPASIIGNVLSERFNEEMTKPGQQSWSISTEEPFETLQKVVTDLVARKQTPVFMMIDMQRLQTASTGIKALFNKGKVRTNPETERRHIEIINFAKEKKLPMIDVNY
ncbi:RHS repeat protein [Kosakonia pseudosacchari]|uniref:RHS repeat domain-containing protein n=1 Tax=Kosakonia pseudosacchari TaxID=1646340 RepID=UPI0022F0B49B|nr:RHS repeat domain-containing protein [Kosakonia pseudosacchari]WBU50858.1 RHS repeat protein [Kosakonia pseudosacchari]